MVRIWHGFGRIEGRGAYGWIEPENCIWGLEGNSDPRDRARPAEFPGAFAP